MVCRKWLVSWHKPVTEHRSSLSPGIWSHLPTGQWAGYMAAYVGAQTAWGLRLYCTGKAHKEHHYRFVSPVRRGSALVHSFTVGIVVEWLAFKRIMRSSSLWKVAWVDQITWDTYVSVMWLWVSHLPILCFCFLIWKLGIKILIVFIEMLWRINYICVCSNRNPD